MTRVYAVSDVETSGLNAHTDKLLEVAIMLVDDTLNEIARMSEVVHYQQFSLNDIFKHSDPFVQDMHTVNGLWDECEEFGPGPNTVDLIVSEWLKANIPAGAEVRTVGNSLRLDLNFLEAHLPKTYEVLGYRSVDMSAVEEFARTFTGMPSFEKTPVASHRAMADVEQCYLQMLHAANRLVSIEPSLYGHYYQPEGARVA